MSGSTLPTVTVPSNPFLITKPVLEGTDLKTHQLERALADAARTWQRDHSDQEAGDRHAA